MRYAVPLLLLLALPAIACGGDGGEQAPTAMQTAPEPTSTLAPPTATPFAPGQLALAYADSDGNVWLISADGSDRNQLIESSRCPGEGMLLFWSPAGDRLACWTFLSGSTNALVVVDTEGQVLTEVEFAGGFVWSTTGQHMAYGILASMAGGASQPEITTVLADADGNVIDELAGVSGVVWSPDGSAVAYTTDSSEVVIHDIATGDDETVGADVGGVLAWVLGGDALLVLANLQEEEEFTTFGVNLLDLADGGLTPIPELNSQSGFSLEGFMWLSPDRSKLVVLGPAAPPWRVAILDLTTLSVSPIESSVISFPSEGIPFMHIAFSQDGSQIAWADVPTGPDATIYRAQSDSAELTEHATVPALEVAFSPDLTKVAYIVPVDHGPQSTLWTANIDGSDAVEIGLGAFPIWRPQP